MNLEQQRRLQEAGRTFFPRFRESAFTMVEIVMALGVISIAMVAIMGVLPLGLKVQRENREDTTMLMDGSYFLEAIRGGAKGLDDLTNYVQAITISNSSVVIEYSNPPKNGRGITSGFQIVGLLSSPKYPGASGLISNTVTARISAVAGSAASRNRTARDSVGFNYLLTSEIIPAASMPPQMTNFVISGAQASTPDNLARSNNWRRAINLSSNLYEVKLTFQWPLHSRPSGYVVGSGRKVYRTLVSGQLTRQNVDLGSGPVTYYFLEPARFVQAK